MLLTRTIALYVLNSDENTAHNVEFSCIEKRVNVNIKCFKSLRYHCYWHYGFYDNFTAIPLGKHNLNWMAGISSYHLVVLSPRASLNTSIQFEYEIPATLNIL